MSLLKEDWVNVMPESKPFYESKTFWANILVVLASVFTDISNFLGTGGTLTFVAVLNIALRVITKSPVTLK